MKRVGLVSLFSACAVAGLLTALAFAGNGPLGRLAGTTTSSTATTTTATTGTTTGPASQVLPEGVTIGGVPVGGLTGADAAAAVRDAFATPLPLAFASYRFTADPNVLAAPNVAKALERARAARPFQNVELVVVVRAPKVKSYVAKLAARVDRKAVDSRLLLRHSRPFVTKSKPGRALVRSAAEHQITVELEGNVRNVVKLRAKPVQPSVTRQSIGPVIVIVRSANHLNLYHGMTPWRVFPVATGQAAYPTPLGHFQIVVKWRDPWWYPPNSPWAKGAKPIPPGPGNPLGTRWMGLSAPGVGIHGTPDAASIGYSVSHGCIRMRIPEAEWLFNHVEIGTPVFIVA
jgi:lipoprotein-anchoring transpeptidase ErfK/SrfK